MLLIDAARRSPSHELTDMATEFLKQAKPALPARLALDLTQQEAIPPAGIAAALSLLESGRLHRYGETGGQPSEVSSLEAEFARSACATASR